MHFRNDVHELSRKYYGCLYPMNTLNMTPKAKNRTLDSQLRRASEVWFTPSVILHRCQLSRSPMCPGVAVTVPRDTSASALGTHPRHHVIGRFHLASSNRIPHRAKQY